MATSASTFRRTSSFETWKDGPPNCLPIETPGRHSGLDVAELCEARRGLSLRHATRQVRLANITQPTDSSGTPSAAARPGVQPQPRRQGQLYLSGPHLRAARWRRYAGTIAKATAGCAPRQRPYRKTRRQRRAGRAMLVLRAGAAEGEEHGRSGLRATGLKHDASSGLKTRRLEDKIATGLGAERRA